MKADYIFPFLWLRDQSEETLRTEIEKIAECGIRSVCVESRPHPDFGGPGWWRDFDIILDEAEKRDMKVWILDDSHFPTGQANGLLPVKYKERARKYLMMQHTDCVGPVAAATLDVDLMMTKAFTWLDFGKPINKPLLDEKKLLSVIAVPLLEQDTIGDQYQDLTPFVKDGILHWDIPDGVWRICVNFETYDFGARNEYINYIDAKSVDVQIEAIYELHYERYKEKFGNTIAGFFSDEPGFYNVDNFDMDHAIGRKKMALPWCDEFFGLMEEEAGSDWIFRIPQIWYDTETKELSYAMRKHYMEKVSFLYKKNFSDRIGKWCEDHNVQYIGHVIEDNDEHTRLGCGAGHFFRAMSGQHMAGIDTIGGQIIPGNPYGARHGAAYVGDGRFNHFVLGKLGASSAQIDPKKKGRLMCEAFGAYGWSFGVKSMKWLVDFLLVQGVNHFVPHAFSMAPFPDNDCPPHFYAGGKNPQFPYFAELMKYTNQMCELFNGGKNVPVVGVLYPAEQDWLNECMLLQNPARQLLEHQIDFEIVPLDVFEETERYQTKIQNGCFVVNERKMSALVVPYSEYLDGKTADRICELAEHGVKVYFIKAYPEKIVGKRDCNPSKIFQNCYVTEEEKLADTLWQQGYYDIKTDVPCRHLTYYHYQKDADYYFLFNTSLSEAAECTVSFRDVRKAGIYNGWTKEYTEADTLVTEEGTKISIHLQPYESIVLVFGARGKLLPAVPKQKPFFEMDLSNKWYVSQALSEKYPEFSNPEFIEELKPYSEWHPRFSGIIKYNKKIRLDDVQNVIFEAEHIYENAELFVNGISAGKKLTPPYRWDISGLCQEGDNSISVEVVNTPVRGTLDQPGIFGPPREMLEPAGMFGKIVLKFDQQN